MRGPNFAKLGEDIGRSFIHKKNKFVLAIGYLAAFSNAGGSKLRDDENVVKFRTSDPVKLGEGWARSLYRGC